jgi:hypothetical protein
MLNNAVGVAYALLREAILALGYGKDEAAA